MMEGVDVIIQGNYFGVFWNILVGTERRKGFVIITTENIIISLVNNGGNYV